MTRPQINVSITQALVRRGDESATGTAFIVYAGAAGPASPVRCYSAADATAAGVPDPIAAWVGDTLAEGAPSVVIVRALANDAANVTGPEWTAGLAKLTADLGPGQVCIPGVATSGAYSALLAHAAATGRVALLDAVASPTAATLATTAAGMSAAAGADRSALITPWVTVPASAGLTRDVPGSLIAAGLAARGDARVGHANHAPAGLHDGGAGVSNRGTTVTKLYTDTEVDTLYDAGVSTIRIVRGQPTLMGWESLAPAASLFHQLNIGRTAMALVSGVASVMDLFLFRQIDGRGQLFAELEGALRGYLQPLWQANALYGATADEAFDVDVTSVNTSVTVAAGQLNAAVEVALTPHAEKVRITVAASLAAAA